MIPAITEAGWNGGYGKMVEIEHANGLATRYGHLSQIDVREGQSIKLGPIIGRIGSVRIDPALAAAESPALP